MKKWLHCVIRWPDGDIPMKLHWYSDLLMCGGLFVKDCGRWYCTRPDIDNCCGGIRYYTVFFWYYYSVCNVWRMCVILLYLLLFLFCNYYSVRWRRTTAIYCWRIAHALYGMTCASWPIGGGPVTEGVAPAAGCSAFTGCSWRLAAPVALWWTPASADQQAIPGRWRLFGGRPVLWQYWWLSGADDDWNWLMQYSSIRRFPGWHHYVRDAPLRSFCQVLQPGRYYWRLHWRLILCVVLFYCDWLLVLKLLCPAVGRRLFWRDCCIYCVILLLCDHWPNGEDRIVWKPSQAILTFVTIIGLVSDGICWLFVFEADTLPTLWLPVTIIWWPLTSEDGRPITTFYLFYIAIGDLILCGGPIVVHCAELRKIIILLLVIFSALRDQLGEYCGDYSRRTHSRNPSDSVWLTYSTNWSVKRYSGCYCIRCYSVLFIPEYSVVCIETIETDCWLFVWFYSQCCVQYQRACGMRTCIALVIGCMWERPLFDDIV